MQAAAGVLLAALLLSACVTDWRSRRIPNSLVLTGLLVGIFFQAVAPAGSGLFHFHAPGSIGPMSSALGVLTGLAILMPFYLLRAMGAGDVKLLAMAGAWLGPTGVAWAALWTTIAGGLLSVLAMLLARSTNQVLTNLRSMLMNSAFKVASGRMPQVDGPATPTTGRLPYALAITTGVAIEIARHWA